jgi:RsiW-degrading membrane proteinase PrsW (M82 family)
MALVRFRRHISEQSGIIFGAAVGMGFAALESAGYSFSAFLETAGSLSLTVILTLFRALLAPAGHGVWTAILAGVLFLESAPYRFRLTRKVLLAFVAVSFLHGLWNSLPLLLTGPPVLVGQLVIAATGLLILAALWQQAKRRQIP